jgi:hypothetical protein
MVASRQRSGCKKIQGKRQSSKKHSIQKLREILIKRKDEITNVQSNDGHDEETVDAMGSGDGQDDQDNSEDEFIDEEYEMQSTKSTLIDIFTEKGLIEYLKTTAGGGKLESSAVTAMNRIIDYLLWMHENINAETIHTFKAIYIFDSFYMIILQDHVGKIVNYCSYLEQDRNFAPQTIRNILYDIKNISYWYLMVFQKTPNSGDIWLPLDNLITKCCLKENRRDRQIKSSGKSIETVIADRRWPVNGLQELQQSCMDEITKYNDMNKATFIDERFYNEFMKLLYSTYYVFNVQGRVGAFTTLTYAQGGEMLHTGIDLMTLYLHVTVKLMQHTF